MEYLQDRSRIHSICRQTLLGGIGVDEYDSELLAILREARNITHATDLLYVTQSSPSERTSVIEQELGVTLILHSHQGIRFTSESGEVLRRTVETAH